MLGIDGLALAGASLIVIQNGIAPARVVRLDLEAGHAHGHVLVRSTPGLGEPTLGVVVGPELYFVANSGWERFPDDGSVIPAMAGPRVISTRW